MSHQKRVGLKGQLGLSQGSIWTESPGLFTVNKIRAGLGA